MKIRPENSQIATILTLVMAVIFLLIVITINIGNITQEKTMVSNTADSAALLLASMIGSLSNGLRMKLGLWEESEKNCEWDFLVAQIVAAVIAVIVSIIFAVATWGAGIGTVGAALSFAGYVLAAAGSAAVFVGGVMTAASEPGSFKQAELQFQNMTFEERIKEQAIQMSLYSLVGDPNKNCVKRSCLTTGGGDPALYGGCSDPEDLDMDGKTNGDCISCFAYWYTARLKSLPRKGDEVQAIFDALFFNPRLLKEGETPPISGVKLPRIYVKRDEETWKAVENSYGFWIDTNNNKLADADGDSFLSMSPYSDDKTNIAGVVYTYDIKFTDWLQGRFTPLVNRLYEDGYGLSADKKKTLENIKGLAKEIGDFEKVVAGLYGSEFDGMLASFEEWLAVFYNGTDKYKGTKDERSKHKQDWYDRMQEWTVTVESWIDTLQNREGEINDCVGSCKALGPYSCGEKAGEVCEQIFVPKTCTRRIEQTCTDPVTDEPYDCSYDEDYDCSYCDPPTKWCNCANGPEINGGRLCPSGYCVPTHTCSTPPDGGKGVVSIACCTIADNGLYYQLCPPEGISSGGDSAKCGAVPCPDTYYQCGYNPNNNVIAREHAIAYLQQFKKDVKDLMKAFKDGYTAGQLKDSDPRFYEALYEWEDYAGRKGEVTSQRVKHAVYVKLSDNLRPDNGFKLPYPHQWRDWWTLGNRLCTGVENETGEFGIVVARYDQDVGTGENAPLRKLWVFKTRQKTSGTEPAFPLSYIDPGKPVDEQARKFVLRNGIVSATKGYFGPGYTFKKEEIKERDPDVFKASKINKDIKIERAKWSDFITIKD